MSNRNALLEEIRTGITLKATKTVDKSQPVLKVDGESIRKMIALPLASPPPPPPLLPPQMLAMAKPVDSPSLKLNSVSRPASRADRTSPNSASPPKFDREALLNDIRQGKKLRHIEVKEKHVFDPATMKIRAESPMESITEKEKVCENSSPENQTVCNQTVMKKMAKLPPLPDGARPAPREPLKAVIESYTAENPEIAMNNRLVAEELRSARFLATRLGRLVTAEINEASKDLTERQVAVSSPSDTEKHPKVPASGGIVSNGKKACDVSPKVPEANVAIRPRAATLKPMLTEKPIITYDSSVLPSGQSSTETSSRRPAFNRNMFLKKPSRYLSDSDEMSPSSPRTILPSHPLPAKIAEDEEKKAIIDVSLPVPTQWNATDGSVQQNGEHPGERPTEIQPSQRAAKPTSLEYINSCPRPFVSPARNGDYAKNRVLQNGPSHDSFNTKMTDAPASQKFTKTVTYLRSGRSCLSCSSDSDLTTTDSHGPNARRFLPDVHGLKEKFERQNNGDEVRSCSTSSESTVDSYSSGSSVYKRHITTVTKMLKSPIAGSLEQRNSPKAKLIISPKSVNIKTVPSDQMVHLKTLPKTSDDFTGTEAGAGTDKVSRPSIAALAEMWVRRQGNGDDVFQDRGERTGVNALTDDSIDVSVAQLVGIPVDALRQFRFEIDINDPEGATLKLRKRFISSSQEEV